VVIEVPTEEVAELTEQMQNRHRFVLDPSHLALSGRCVHCIAQDSS
jgi:Fe2+ or Zn2+ uptake regulation protein